MAEELSEVSRPGLSLMGEEGMRVMEIVSKLSEGAMTLAEVDDDRITREPGVGGPIVVEIDEASWREFNAPDESPVVQ